MWGGEKTCTKCNIEQSVNNFRLLRKHKTRNARCKECERQAAREYYRKNSAWVRKRTRQWQIDNPEHCRAYRATLKKKPEVMVQAGKLVNSLVKQGYIKPERCAICGEERTEAHHDSYQVENWLRVTWLCRPHHRAWHRVLESEGLQLTPTEEE